MQNKRTITQHYKRILITLFVGLTLNGCTGLKPKDVITTTEHINTCLTPPDAATIVMRTPTFYVTKDVNGVLWISISPQDYQKMSENTAEILTHLKQKNAVVKYYKKCVESNDKDTK